MAPFTYAGGPAVRPDDPAFVAGPVAGAAMPGAGLDESFLSDRPAPGFTLVCFDPVLAPRECAGRGPGAEDAVFRGGPGDAGDETEAIYEALARAIDRAVPEPPKLFLARACLLMAQEPGDGKRALKAIAVAGGG